MFERLLIANRGEIAGRIARTAAGLGIETVGVYSDTDRFALHLDAVDLAVSLGGATPAESYLLGESILEAATRTGCCAIHPGYGFLAESADFAQMVVDAGLTFVGPPPDQIRLLGDKVQAKRAAARAGVPTAPIHEVEPGMVPPGVTMPALVKAAAGGGGRGMRLVTEAGKLKEAVDAASREAEAAFGDPTVFIEPFIARGRHVEVQIIGDSFGNGVHLGERECSIQRRSQKIIEEAPSVGIDNDTRLALHEGAIALGRSVEYENAGTVEFLVGEDQSITFLEVNTRIQVEHAVTEAITGLDLVELQLRVAAGEELPFRQEDVRFDGHAIEVRVVAEDPATGWMPSAGTIAEFDIDPTLRVDTGVEVGSYVSSDYDSLIAKLVAHGSDRDEAIRILARGLKASRISGPSTNLATLIAITRERDFRSGDTPTSYLLDHPEVEQAAVVSDDELPAHLVTAAMAVEALHRESDSPTSFAPSGWRNLRTQGQRQIWTTLGRQMRVEYVLDGSAGRFLIGDWPEPDEAGTLSPDERTVVDAAILDRSAKETVLEIDGIRRRVGFTIETEGHIAVHTHSSNGSRSWRLAPLFVPPTADQLASGPVSPLPGTIIAVRVQSGDRVEPGDVLVVVEAMKMEHAITADRTASVVKVPFEEGDRVDAGDILVELADPPE